MDIREPNRRAVRASVEVVGQVTVADLGRATPCEGWTLADLLAHMTVQHEGFAAAASATAPAATATGATAATGVVGATGATGVVGATGAAAAVGAADTVGGGDDLAVWRVRSLGDDAVAAYASAAERVLAAVAEPGVLERGFVLPEFGTTRPFPARQAIGFHFIDYVVHGWDVARSLGVPYALDADLLEAAWPIAQAVPNGETRLTEGAAFRPALAAEPDADRLDQILAALGRSPAW